MKSIKEKLKERYVSFLENALNQTKENYVPKIV